MTPRTTATDIGATSAEDARFERTRVKLTEAVLELASEQDVTTASVAELSRRAQINRSTFYSHADSPMQVLTRVLSQDLDDVRRRTAEQLDRDGLLLRDVTRTTLQEIISHVERYESVYHSANRTSSMYALRVVLAEHVEASVLGVFQEGFVIPPKPDARSAALFAAFIAHGVAGAVEAWLRQAKPRSQAQLLEAVESVYPSWYAPHPKRRNKPATKVTHNKGEIA